MEPASLSYGVGRAHFALNRREPTAKGIKLGKNPAGPTDESVPILRVQDAERQADGDRLRLRLPQHDASARHDAASTPITPGMPRTGSRQTIPGATALFVTGCAGDADPHPFGTLDLAKEHGRELGDAVKFVLDRPAMLTPLSGSLRAAFTETTIHFGGPTDEASYEKLLNDPNTGPQAARAADDRGDRPRQADPDRVSLRRAGLRPGRPVDAARPLGRGRGRLRDPAPARARRRRPSRSGWPRTPTTSSATSPRSASSRKGATRAARPSTAAPCPRRWPRTSSRSSSRRRTRWSRRCGSR